jgi:glycosyltransferase involved in cell wall biosynthesis
MNIWLLTGEYPPDYGGGIATYSYHTTQMMLARGHQLTIFATAENLPGGWQIEEPSERLRVVRFGANQSPQSKILGEFARWSYDAALVVKEFCSKEGPPDVLEAQEYLGMPYYLLMRRLALDEELTNLPILVTAHTPLYLCQKYNQLPIYRFPGYWIGEMERYSLLAADQVVYPSRFLRNEIERDQSHIRDHSRVIANPYQFPEQLKIPPGNSHRRGFLFNARIEKRKGIESLLSAFSQQWEIGLDEPLYLVGDDWQDELNRSVMSKVIHKQYGKFIQAGLLIWEGKQPPQVVKQRLSQVRALIMPSLLENFPYAVIEAMAAGCPVIVSQSGGHAELVEDGISGFIFSHQKKGDLERKINLVCNLNPDEQARIVTSAQARVEQMCGYEVVAPQKEEALELAQDQLQPRKYYPFLRAIERRNDHPDEEKKLERAGLLSVVIPFFNMGDFLEDAIKPFERLKDVSFEIIVVDDGSDDQNSLEKLLVLQNQYHFRVQYAGAQGLSAMRNIGAKLAKGEFIAFLDADDCMDPLIYQRAIKIFHQYENVSFVGCWAEYFGDVQGFWPTWTPEPPYALVHNPINTSALIYRRKDFIRYGLNDPVFEHVMEDYDSLLSLLEHGCRGVVIPEPYFKYRVRRDSMFHSTSELIKIEAYQHLAQKHRELFSLYAEDILGITISNGPGYLYDNPTLWYPEIGYKNGSGDASNSASHRNDLSQVSRKYLSYYIFRSIFHKPYVKLREIFPGLEHLARIIREKWGDIY